jgi:hypothetical protein
MLLHHFGDPNRISDITNHGVQAERVQAVFELQANGMKTVLIPVEHDQRGRLQF